METAPMVQVLTLPSNCGKNLMRQPQRNIDHTEPPLTLGHSRRNTGSAATIEAYTLRAQRYHKAETRLSQSFRCCENVPSIEELQLRTLKRATQMLAHFAEESGHQAKHLASITSDRARVAEVDPEIYHSMLSQRWKVQHHQDLISRHMKVLQQTITSLTTIPSGSGNKPFIDGHEDQVPLPKDRTYTNLVSFLCRPHRVAPLRHRSHPRLPKVHQQLLYLNGPYMPNIATDSPKMSMMKSVTTDSSSDMSLDMQLQTPVVTDSLAEQQAQFAIGKEEAGTAIILTRPLPAPTLPDPSKVQVDLPNYVHELLADFDAQTHYLSPADTSIKFQSEDTASGGTRKGGLWPFSSLSKNRRPRSATSQPDLRSMSSFKRLRGFMSASETLSSGKKVNPGRSDSRITLTSISEAGPRGETESPACSTSTSTSITQKIASMIFRRFSRPSTQT